MSKLSLRARRIAAIVVAATLVAGCASNGGGSMGSEMRQVMGTVAQSS